MREGGSASLSSHLEESTTEGTCPSTSMVEYDFKYYKMEMEADVQLLILSEGKSNILLADLVLPFCPLSVESCEIGHAEALKAWRWYLASLKSLPHSIKPDMQKLYFNASDPLSELWRIAWIIPAFWTLLAFSLLVVICVLWAPSSNPTSYLL
ncbi:Mini-chromosome maintenance complex-binding protein [Camellia lanceoleosa]|uniref:Mini-chromosome maintenance complex-binding protein n=1 Tax=Camellia lanceoleosa TaxID=1840588 RepID=A0ACC0H634_9ERIC|nr:Mini-chromosome maintenance complex-binding protein [Camellia lanceoleosa]